MFGNVCLNYRKKCNNLKMKEGVLYFVIIVIYKEATKIIKSHEKKMKNTQIYGNFLKCH